MIAMSSYPDLGRNFLDSSLLGGRLSVSSSVNAPKISRFLVSGSLQWSADALLALIEGVTRPRMRQWRITINGTRLPPSDQTILVHSVAMLQRSHESVMVL